MEEQIYKEAKAFGIAEKKSDGCLTWDTFLHIQKITMKYVHVITQDRLIEYAKERRALLKEGKDKEYEQNVIESTAWNLEVRNNMCNFLYAIFEISKECSNLTQRTYFQDLSKKIQFQREMDECSIETRGDKGHTKE